MVTQRWLHFRQRLFRGATNKNFLRPRTMRNVYLVMWGIKERRGENEKSCVDVRVGGVFVGLRG